MATKYQTFKNKVVLHAGQIIGYLRGKGYYAKTLGAPVPGALTPHERVVQKALSQLGQRENPAGSNMQKYGAWFGLNGEPWCAIFTSWCCDGVLPFKYSYVPAVVEAARKGKAGLVVIGQPVTGCFACYDWPPRDGTADHIGLYVTEALLARLVPKALAQAKRDYGPLGAGDFWAVEGNTSVSNQSNGGEVMLRKRNRTDVQAFVLQS